MALLREALGAALTGQSRLALYWSTRIAI